ncbi:MAG: hypothetical protein QNJ55_02865 [Xenococcus sp. MO_188.B8]|nr:hypothetical protein [Xenococcus sp. MO_188.B8]
MNNKELLAQSMAFLMQTTPETALGKLLDFCLAAKVDPDNSGKTALEFALELLDNPEKLARWTSDVIDSDNDFSVDEMIALEQIPVKNPKNFMNQVFAELENLERQRSKN